jgi:hypothetical protein
MNEIAHFRVLYRQFLFRLMDVELLAPSAGGDASGLLGQFSALLVFGSLMLALAAGTAGLALRRAPVAALWSAEVALISLSLVVVGVFALLSWDTLFVDRQDALVFSPLPVRGGVLLAAKAAATASALGLTFAAWNCLAGFAWPLVLARGSETIRFVAAYWLTVAMAGTFLFCALLSTQALISQLPGRWRLRASAGVQMLVFAALLGMLLLRGNEARLWAPAWWFTGLWNELGGVTSVEGQSLARRAVAATILAVAGAVVSFLLSYPRALRRAVEEPDAAAGRGSSWWLPRFGSRRETALAHFTLRTLARSRRHRSLLAFWLGGGSAVAAVYLAGAPEITQSGWGSLLAQANSYALAASVILLCASWWGVRGVYGIPLQPRANWIFQVIAPFPSEAVRRAARRALLFAAVLPVVVFFAVLFAWTWPLRLVGQHCLLLALAGTALAGASLREFRSIPFTCRYLPGRNKVHLVFWFGVIPLLIAIHKLARWELEAFNDAPAFGILVAALGAGAAAATWSSSAADADVVFEEEDSEELTALRRLC